MNKRSRSRDASSHPRLGHTTARKPFQRPPVLSRMIFSENRNGTFRDHAKKGGGAPISASTGVRPAAEKKACQRMRRAPASSPSRTARESFEAAPSPFGAPPRLCAEGVTLRLGFKAALPGIAGCKREDPPRRQCSEHLALRSRAGGDDAQAARMRGARPRFREPLPLRLKEYPREGVLRRAGFLIRGICN